MNIFFKIIYKSIIYKAYVFIVFSLTLTVPTFGQFITTWQTDDTEITIPTFGGESYMYDVAWTNLTNAGVGDGAITGVTGDYTITGLANSDIYQVEIAATSASFPRIYFNNSGDKEKILTIEQWGANQWTSMANAFYGCSNLTLAASDAPDLFNAFDLTYMFRGASSLNADLGTWDVSNVELFIGMFRSATSFNGDLTWDVSSAEDMSEMFYFASSFNQNIGLWQTENVNNMALMFANATAFNQNIMTSPAAVPIYWITSSVMNMDQMLSGAEAFNQPIGNWNVSNVTLMRSMFSGATVFNEDISSWNISGLTNMSNFFRNASAFNQDLSAWNLLVGSVSNMQSMFEGAIAFNQNINGWDVSAVTTMASMFENTTYNQNISGWPVSNVTNFHSMFSGNTAFNQDISGWTINSVSNFIDMRLMFDGASSFNQNLGGWNISGLDNAVKMLDNSGLSVENYDNLLIGWGGQPHQTGVNLGASGLYYCSGEAARASLIAGSFGISDAGVGCIRVYAGSSVIAPEISNGQIELIDIGSGPVATGKTQTITIRNELAVPITNLIISFGGTSFTSVSPPLTIPAGGSLPFDILLSSLTPGVFDDNVSITSDNFTTPFTFDITGEITDLPEPEIAVFEASQGTVILNGLSTYNIGEELRGTDAFNYIRITNKGSAQLDITSLSVSGTMFSLDQTAAISIAVDASIIIEILLDGTIAESYSETVTINSNDDDESVFNFTVSGVIFGPEIQIYNGPDRYSYPEIINNQAGPVDLGFGIEGGDISKQLTIGNFGPVDLSISDISITGSSFSISPSPPLLVDAEEDGVITTQILDIILDGSTPGTFSETVTILSDDDSDPTFTFSLIGEILGSASSIPKIYWTEANNELINRSNLDGTVFENFTTPLSDEPQGIAIDTLNDVIYWTTNNGLVMRGDIGVSSLENISVIIDESMIFTSRPYSGITLDIPAGKMYWISNWDNSIKTADIFAPDPNTTIQTLITGLSETRGITLDPINSKLYYTQNILVSVDWNAHLYQADLDGSSAISIYSIVKPGIKYYFTDLKLDIPNDYIYWTGGESTRLSSGDIYSASLGDISGTLTSFSTPGDPHGLDLDLIREKIYWVDKGIESGEVERIFRANFDGSNKEILHEGFPNLTQPLYLVLDLPPKASACSNPPTADAGTDQTICEADTIILNATIGGGASTVSWTTPGDGTFDDNTSLKATYTPGTNDISSGTVTLTITTDDPDGADICEVATDDIVIIIENTPSVNAGANQDICSPDVVNLTGVLAGSATTATWTTNGDGAFDDPSLLTAAYTPGSTDITNSAITLTLTTIAGVSCSSISDDIIISISLPIAVIDQSASLDVASTIIIDVKAGGTFNTSDVLVTTLLTQPTKGAAMMLTDGSIEYTSAASTVGADNFDFQVCNQCGLCSSASVAITINNVPPTVTVAPSTIESGGILTINVLDDLTDDNGNVDLSSLKILIQPLSGAIATLDATGVLTVDYAGVKFAGTDELTIEICDLLGSCTQTIITIEVAPPGVVVFNAVSPNGDGKHDFLEIEGAEFYPSNQVKIMNRWGEIVFETQGYDNANKAFNGINNGGGELPSGTYYYLISLGDGSEDMNGFFSLRR